MGSLQLRQGAPAPPQPQACSPSHGRSGWPSHTHPESSHTEHFFMTPTLLACRAFVSQLKPVGRLLSSLDRWVTATSARPGYRAVSIPENAGVTLSPGGVAYSDQVAPRRAYVEDQRTPTRRNLFPQGSRCERRNSRFWPIHAPFQGPPGRFSSGVSVDHACTYLLP
jgi:hypothetical protein